MMKPEAVAALLILLVVAALALLSPPGAAFLERALGKLPEARVAEYVQAVARGDERAAEAVWKVPGSLPGDLVDRLEERRRAVTRDLMARRLRPTFAVIGTEWWSLCCEPRVVDDPRYAGGARMTVQLTSDDGASLIYVFDVFARGETCWEGDSFCLPRQWVLRDVYPLGEEPLFWRAVYRCEPDGGCEVRWLDS
ncbi:MAG: hypothetical protein H5T61_13375 [Thermoflexales bacterium]|nr:hypothetical protein [Thermoflexales bacterium]